MAGVASRILQNMKIRIIQKGSIDDAFKRFHSRAYLLYVPDGVFVEIELDEVHPTPWSYDGWGQPGVTCKAAIATAKQQWLTTIVRRETYDQQFRLLIRATWLLNKGATFPEPQVVSGAKGWKRLNEWVQARESLHLTRSKANGS